MSETRTATDREDEPFEPMHVDFILNQWERGQQVRVGWLDVAWAATYTSFSPWGSYAFRSYPHTQAECPWNDYPSNEIPMVEGDLSDLLVPDEAVTDG
jgi:hypothetical protein